MNKADLIFAAGEASADILYTSGFHAPDPFIYFACLQERAVIVSALEQDRAEKECKANIAIFSRNDFSQNEKAGNLDIICSLAESRNISEFRVPRDFPLALADALRKRGLVVIPEKGIFYPQRQYKSNDEIIHISAASRVAEAGMRRGTDIIKEASVNKDNILEWNGEILSSEILRAEINICMIRRGGFSDSTIAACGSHAAEPHNTGSGPIFANKTIIMDIFPRIRKSAYWGDLTRTVVKGKAPEIVKKAYEAVFEAREYTKTLIKPGAIPAKIHQAAKELMEKQGFHTGRKNGHNFGFFHGLGHGIGLEIHENPSLNPRNFEPLKGGEAITVEPGLYYPEWGGVRLEDIITVTKDGCNCLTQMENILEI
ncbi:MAG: M24 family metallopeptidase [Victivallaceae bacterium]|nr:M24 family metallopeptidase [Victivallaceae bacterium]